MCGAPSLTAFDSRPCQVLASSMARTVRTRSMSADQTGGYSTYVYGVYQGYYANTISRTNTITDYHGRPVTPSPLTITGYSGPGLSMSGDVRSSYSPNILERHNKHPYKPSAGSLKTTPLAAPSGWYLDTVAGTNPSRPVMTPPTLLQDLIDIPAQLRSLGKLINKPKSLMSSREIANHYLCVQFGWLPLIEDVRQLLDLQSYVLKRTKELHDLYSGQGLRRRIKFAEDHQVGSGIDSWPLAGATNYVDRKYDITVNRRSWATIRWRPTTPPPYDPSDVRWNNLSRRIVLGLTVEGLTKGLWDVIPWTWLLGWFTNIGKYALAYSNTVPASHTEACFMSESIRTYTANGIVYRNGYGNLSNDGSLVVRTKTRLVSGALTPGFNVPFLDTFRLSILGALFTQRTMR